jgi:hypothetical protein
MHSSLCSQLLVHGMEHHNSSFVQARRRRALQGAKVCGWVVAHYRGRGASAAEEYRAGGEQEAANGEVVGGGLVPLRFRAATRIPGSALAGFLRSSRAD